MKLKFLTLYLFIACVSLFLTSCSDDDDAVVDITVTPPSTYKFERNGKSTVSFSGQTSRLKMAGELYSGMKSSSSTKAGLNNMFNNGTGFSDAILDASGKKVGNKTFASSVASATVKPMFDAMITDFADNVIPNWSTTAADGTAGKMTDSKRTVYINIKFPDHIINK